MKKGRSNLRLVRLGRINGVEAVNRTKEISIKNNKLVLKMDSSGIEKIFHMVNPLLFRESISLAGRKQSLIVLNNLERIYTP